MSDAAPQVETRPAPAIRRFQTADIQKHAEWLFPRMARAYPHLGREQHYTWLLNMLNNGDDFCPLYADCGIAVASIVSKPMRPNACVEEQFVFLRDAADPEQQFVGGHFYRLFYDWALQRGIKTLFIEGNTDVQRKAIAEATGARIFDAKQAYMRA